MDRVVRVIGLLAAVMCIAVGHATGAGPEVVQVTPVSMSFDVPSDVIFSATFDQEMDSTSINDETFCVYGSFSGKMTGLVAFDTQSHIATFTPSETFLPGEKVTAILTSSVESSDGTPLADGFVWESVVQSASGPTNFKSRTDVSAGDHPWSVCAADFDNDGDVDLATSAYNSSDLTILLNDGAGDFTSGDNYTLSTYPREVIAEDFNGDGNPDLAVISARYMGGSLAVFMGMGDGSFEQPQTYTVYCRTSDVISTDVDGDGDIDIYALFPDDCWWQTGISCFHNDGSGNFTCVDRTIEGWMPVPSAFGDLDADGHIDMLLGECMYYDMALEFINEGNGECVYTTAYETGEMPTGIEIADLNMDGVADFVSANQDSNSLTVILRSESSGATISTNYEVGKKPYGVATADINGDGYPDIITTCKGSGTVVILANSGDGNLGEPAAFSVGENPKSVALADFDGDSDLDIAVANATTDNCSILLNEVVPDDYIIGDANASGFVDIDDGVYLITYIFSGGPPPLPLESGDADMSGFTDIDDVVFLINYIFLGGPAPGARPLREMIDHGACKTFQKSTPIDSIIPPTQDCIVWEYDGASVLRITHVNTGFNCLPIIESNVHVGESEIELEEIEIRGDATCLCLFDLEYEITGIAPGVYSFSVIVTEHLPFGYTDLHNFTMDLNAEPDGSSCITRYGSPWDIE